MLDQTELDAAFAYAIKHYRSAANGCTSAAGALTFLEMASMIEKVQCSLAHTETLRAKEAAPEFEQCPDLILEHLKAPAGWLWEGDFWSYDDASGSYALGNANGHLTCDIYVKDDVVEVKDFATVAAAIQFMKEVARA